MIKYLAAAAALVVVATGVSHAAPVIGVEELSAARWGFSDAAPVVAPDADGPVEIEGGRTRGNIELPPVVTDEVYGGRGRW